MADAPTADAPLAVLRAMYVAMLRIRVCEERLVGRCAWLFLDTSRNHSRRFCSMDECGNRAKQRRHYQRRKHSQP